MATDATVTKHAKAAIEAGVWRKRPPMLVEYAKKGLKWIPKEDGTRVPIQYAEDLFRNAFDGIAVHPGEPTRLVQWTTATNRSARRDKVIAAWEGAFVAWLSTLELEPFEAFKLRDALDQAFTLEVWGWKKARGFVVDRFDQVTGSWQASDELLVPPTLAAGRPLA